MVKKIVGTDTLESGFRAKYNETVDEIITSAVIMPAGVLRLTKFSGGNIDVDLTNVFYTETEIDEFLATAGIVVPNASEEIRGIIRIATLLEVNAGEDDLKAITAYKAKHSSLFPFKGVWFEPDSGMGYRANTFVVKDGKLYQNLEDGNEDDPEDGGDWLLLGGTSDKTIINRNGGDVIDFSLDLTGELIPSNAMITIYINGRTPNAPFTFDATTKVIEGLPSTEPTDTIKIIFI